jgi:AcrR family transcriptional regulator
MTEAELEKQYPMRTSRRKKTRAAIIEAADKLFREYGYKNTTMNSIADAAEVHVTTVFNHFPSKTDLVSKIAGGAVLGLKRAIAEHIGKTPFFTFMRDITKYGSEISSQKKLDAIQSDVGVFLGESPDVMATWVLAEAKKAKMLAAYIAEDYGIDMDKDLRPLLVANMIVTGMVQAFQHWLENGGKTDLTADALAVIDSCEKLLKDGLGQPIKREKVIA